MVIPGALDGERLDRVVSLLCGPDPPGGGRPGGGGRRAGRRAARSPAAPAGWPRATTSRSTGPRPRSPSGPGPRTTSRSRSSTSTTHVIVVDKPAGLVVHPGAGQTAGTLVNGLLARFPEIAAVGAQERPGIVHRLDKGTSGLLVVARTQLAYDSLVAQLAARTVERRYLALVVGPVRQRRRRGRRPGRPGLRQPHPDGGRRPADGRPAPATGCCSSFTQPAKATLVACRLETGRTHQVRVHLAAIGHPVVGDDRYGGARPSIDPGRPFLHASQLGFDHPATGERLRFTSALPDELEKVLGSLR